MTGEAAARLRATVNRAAKQLNAFSEADAEIRPAPGAWSVKEIVGHLIDSASNNHQRFVRAQFTDDLIFPSYEQERWVSVQSYQTAPWSSLVSLWEQFNLHLAHVIENIPAPVADNPRTRHNLDAIAFKTVAREQPATLAYFMDDYIDHLEYHLDEITSQRR